MSVESNFFTNTSVHVDLTSSIGETGCYPTCTPPTLSPAESIEYPPTTIVTQPTKSPEQGGLPFTGSDITELLIFGGLMVAGGAALAKRRFSRS